MKELLIMRHAKSDWSHNVEDKQRPLNKRGKTDAPLMGKMLLKANICPEIIISSTAQRASQTAFEISKAIGYDKEIILEDNFYSQGEETIIKRLHKLPNSITKAMIVAHNPTIEYLISSLTAGNKLNINVPTGAIAHLICDINNWSDLKTSSSNLKSFLIPKLVKNIIKK